MQLTRELFDQIQPDEIFRVVTTRLQRFHEPMEATLTFICVKGRDVDWAIYCGLPQMGIQWIRDHGDKMTSRDIIQNMCPCDQEVFDLYRY